MNLLQIPLMRKLKKSVNFKGVFKGVPVVPEALNFTRDCLKHSFSSRHFDFGLALGPHLHGFFGLFVKYYTFGRNSPPGAPFIFITWQLVHKIVCNMRVRGFCKRIFFSCVMVQEKWKNIKGKCRRYFSYIKCYFFFQNRILRKKLCDFKKKSTSIRSAVQKLFNF